MTPRVPEVVEAARALGARALVLDGEAIALRRTGGRMALPGDRGAASASDELRATIPLPSSSTCCTSTARTCWTGRCASAPPPWTRSCPPAARPARGGRRSRRRRGASRRRARGRTRGRDGQVARRAVRRRAARRRWVKVKPVHTLDLVVLAAEWGHGRRRGRLSNLHLGARDPEKGGWVMLGKTFKGLTDEMLAWQTERLLALASAGRPCRARSSGAVVEIAFDGVQRSPRYPGGVALRFARVALREDKPAPRRTRSTWSAHSPSVSAERRRARGGGGANARLASKPASSGLAASPSTAGNAGRACRPSTRRSAAHRR